MRRALSNIRVRRIHDFLRIPLDESLPGYPENTNGEFRSSPVTELTTLSNGVRVASCETYDMTAAIGMGLDVGIRYESAKERGLSALLRRLLLSSSSSDGRSGQQVTEHLEAIGASVIRSEATCKDSIYVAAELLRPHAKEFLTILRGCASSPFTEEDLEFQKRSLIFEHEDLMMDADRFVPEMVMATAFQGSLGHAAIPEPAVIQAVTLDQVREFRDRHFVGPSVVIAGTGIEHTELVSFAQELFHDLAPESNRRPMMPAVYTGGDCVQVESAKVAERQRLIYGLDSTRIQVGFRAPSLMEDDFYAVSVLMALMGGGSSFSSGGPGKGMYSRLYTRVLNRWHFVQETKSFLMPYEDASLFGIACKVDPHSTMSMLEVVVAEFLTMATEMTDEEFLRAKNKLKSDMFMDLESRIVQIDDVIRQVLLWNKRMSAKEHAEHIDRLSIDEVIQVARRIVSGTPTVVAYGPAESINVVPSAERIQKIFLANLEKLSAAQT